MATRSKTLAQCEAAWKAGVPLKVTSDGFPIVMKPSMNCEYTVKGTQDIAYVGFPQDIPKADLLENIRTFLLTIPRLTAEQFEDAEDGVYTWILASVGGSDPTFYASRTTAMLELGTVHYSIATAVGATAVHGAGEVWKHGNEFTFNFLSGTFMEKWALPKECPLETMQEYLKSKLKTEVFPYLFRSKTLKFRETDPTFVSSRFLELTTGELEEYVKAGFVVCIHDKANKAECKSTKSACKKPMEVVMRGGDFQSPRKARQSGVPYIPPQVSQFEEARRMLTFGEAARPLPTALPRVPTSRLPGMGGRKTKKAKARRRKTRRGGVKHVGEQMAEALVGPERPLQKNVRDSILLRVVRRLKLTYPQVKYLYDNAETMSPMLKEEELVAAMQRR